MWKRSRDRINGSHPRQVPKPLDKEPNFKSMAELQDERTEERPLAPPPWPACKLPRRERETYAPRPEQSVGDSTRCDEEARHHDDGETTRMTSLPTPPLPQATFWHSDLISSRSSKSTTVEMALTFPA